MPIISAADLKHQVISGNVKAITLDTSTVESFKFGFEVGVLAKMEQFSKTDADHLVLDIVLHEIRTHLTSQAELDYAHVKNALKTLGNSWGVDKAERDNALASIFHNQTAAQATSERLEAFLSDSAAVQISCGDYADIKKILPLYYAGRPPFGAKEAKKREFPDAVALLALEAWAEEKSTKVVAVSSDGDWKSYCANSPNIFLIEELSTALSAFQGDADDAAETFRSLLKAGDVVDLVDTIYDELTTEVDRIDIDFEASSNWYFEQELVSSKATYIGNAAEELAKFEVIAFKDGSLSLKTTLSIKLEAEFSVDFQHYDSIDKEYMGFGSTNVSSEEDIQVDAVVTVNFSEGKAQIEEFQLLPCGLIMDFGDLEPDWMSDPDEEGK